MHSSYRISLFIPLLVLSFLFSSAAETYAMDGCWNISGEQTVIFKITGKKYKKKSSFTDVMCFLQDGTEIKTFQDSSGGTGRVIEYENGFRLTYDTAALNHIKRSPNKMLRYLGFSRIRMKVLRSSLSGTQNGDVIEGRTFSKLTGSFYYNGRKVRFSITAPGSFSGIRSAETAMLSDSTDTNGDVSAQGTSGSSQPLPAGFVGSFLNGTVEVMQSELQ